MEINSQLKERLIGGGVIVILACGLVYSFSRKPIEVIKEVVKTEIKVETKIEYKDRIVNNNIVTRRIIKEEPSGSKITEETISDVSKIDESSISKESDVVSTTEVVKETTKYQKDNIASVTYTVDPFNLSRQADVANVQLSVGQRVFSLPVFVTIGTNGKFNQVSAGLTFEF